MTRHDQKSSDDQEPNHQSASKPGRLCIKLKIPNGNNKNKTNLQEEEERTVDDSRSGYRVCDICGKEFSSGKAWGGHKRHHLKAMKESIKKDQILKLTSPNQSSIKKMGVMERCNTIKSGDVKIKGGKPICCLCGKGFPSMNSLFGHMKFHSDRDWKGIEPPLSSTSSSGISETEAEKMSSGPVNSVDLLSSLTGWKKTDRRGKESTVDPVLQAAMDLMKLSRDKRVRSQQLQTSQGCRFKNPTTIESEDDDKGFLKEELAKKMKKKAATAAKKKKLIARLNADEDDDEFIRPGGFKCINCGNSFSTFQALGGHRSSCPGKKSEEASSEGSDDNNQEENQPRPSGGGGNLFPCDICNKSFSTGQALGGHKRIHWKGTAVKTEVAIKREVGDDDDDDDDEGYNGKLGFDLNEPYVLQDDD